MMYLISLVTAIQSAWQQRRWPCRKKTGQSGKNYIGPVSNEEFYV